MEKSKKAFTEFSEGKLDLEAFYQTMTREIVEKLGVTRASIWSFNEAGTEIFCHSLYDNRQDIFYKGIVLKEEDFPSYFSAIRDNCVINAPKADSHSATKCFNEAYFYPNNIYSLLDFIVLKKGVPYGVLCCENCDEVKNWTTEDENYLNQMSSILTLLYRRQETKLAA